MIARLRDGRCDPFDAAAKLGVADARPCPSFRRFPLADLFASSPRASASSTLVLLILSLPTRRSRSDAAEDDVGPAGIDTDCELMAASSRPSDALCSTACAVTLPTVDGLLLAAEPACACACTESIEPEAADEDAAPVGPRAAASDARRSEARTVRARLTPSPAAAAALAALSAADGPPRANIAAAPTRTPDCCMADCCCRFRGCCC